MRSDSPTNLLDVYLAACRNESWADLQTLKRAGRDRSVAVYPARVSKLLPRIPSDRILTALGWTLSLAWPILAPFVFLVEAIRWLVSIRKAPFSASLPVNGRIWFYFSDAFSALSTDTLERLQPDGLILGPLHGPTDRFGGAPTASILGSTQLGDVASAYVSAVRASWAVPLSLGLKHSTQSYTAFQWFATARILNRLLTKTAPREITFLNHYDRWAVLFDHIALGARHVLVQHGVVYRNLAPPQRMAHIDKVHVYSADSAARFRDNILAPGSATIFEHQAPSLRYSEPPLPQGHRFRVVLIGDPFQTVRDVELGLAILRSGLNIELVAKPHPRFSSAPYGVLQEAGAALVQGRETFPRAHVAICGTSTLGVQYETAGCPLVWYDTYDNEEAVRIIVDMAEKHAAQLN